MASPVQFILQTQMSKYFLYHMQYLFSRICWYIGFLVDFIEKMAQLTPVSPTKNDVDGQHQIWTSAVWMRETPKTRVMEEYATEPWHGILATQGGRIWQWDPPNGMRSKGVRMLAQLTGGSTGEVAPSSSRLLTQASMQGMLVASGPESDSGST